MKEQYEVEDQMSFCGIVNMQKDSRLTLYDGEIVEDLVNAGFVKIINVISADDANPKAGDQDKSSADDTDPKDGDQDKSSADDTDPKDGDQDKSSADDANPKTGRSGNSATKKNKKTELNR